MIKSNNPRIEGIIGDSPYKNVEYTLPCEVEPLAEFTPEDEEQRLVLEGVRAGLRFVVDVKDPTKIDPKVVERLKILASPLECGRLLELDETFKIYGENHVVSIKGVGANNRAVEKSIDRVLENDPAAEALPEFQRKVQILRHCRFNEKDFGLFHLGNAHKETMATIEFHDLKARVQKCLGIYEIKRIGQSNGESFSVEDLKKSGFMHEKVCPVILVRAMRTNFRILDLLNLKQLGFQQPFERLIEYSANNDQDVRSYLLRFIYEFLHSEIMLLAKGFRVDNPDWYAHARNVSLEAEEIDLEAMDKPAREFREIRSSWANVLRLFVMLVGPASKDFKMEEIDQLVAATIEEEVDESDLPLEQKWDLKPSLLDHWQRSKKRMLWEIKHGYNFVL